MLCSRLLALLQLAFRDSSKPCKAYCCVWVCWWCVEGASGRSHEWPTGLPESPSHASASTVAEAVKPEAWVFFPEACALSLP